MRNNRQGDVAASVESETGEGTQFFASERFVVVAAELRLNCPKFAVSRAGYEIDTLIQLGKGKPFANIRRHLAQRPHVLKRGHIFWSRLQIKLRQALKRSSLFTG